MSIRDIFLCLPPRKINSRRKLRAGIYDSMTFFAGNDEREFGLCRGPGYRVVGGPVLHYEPLKSSGHDYCICFDFRCLTVWLGEDYQSTMQDMQIRVRFAIRVALGNMAWLRGRADNERVKRVLRQQGVYG